jgi:hypothetical protein
MTDGHHSGAPQEAKNVAGTGPACQGDDRTLMRHIATRFPSVRRSQTTVPAAASVPTGDGPIAVGVVEYYGVSTSTTSLFPRAMLLPADLDDSTLAHLVDELADDTARHVVISGWSPSRLELAARLASRGVRVDAVWHGNYLQTHEDYNWNMFKGVVAAARDSVLTKIGVVKAGMEMWLEGLGLRSAFLLNYVPTIPAGPSVPEQGGPHLGMWLAAEGYRKLPYAMIAAAGMLEGAVLAGTGVSERSLEFARFVGLDTTRLLTSRLPHEDLLTAIERTHVTLYVTQSECGPMLPLESLSRGVPCLVGPNSHLFADDDYLAATLIVPYPDHAEVIAWHLEEALTNRDRIIEAYKAYAPAYIERARNSVVSFLAE